MMAKKPEKPNRPNLRKERPNLKTQVPKAFAGVAGRPPKPQEVMPEQNEIDARIAARADREMEMEQHRVIPDTTIDSQLPGVPLSEELETSPEKIAEYCAREPVVLTGKHSFDKTPKFGIIDARFKALAEPWEKMKEQIEELREKLKDGNIPASVEVSARRSEEFAELVLRILDGDDLTTEFNMAAAKADEYSAAADMAHGIYHKQLQKMFRELEGSMTRREIGMYAQSMWLRNYRPFENNEELNSRFYRREVGDSDDIVLKKHARDNAIQTIKWMALVINEIPVNPATMDDRPTPKPVIH